MDSAFTFRGRPRVLEELFTLSAAVPEGPAEQYTLSLRLGAGARHSPEAPAELHGHAEEADYQAFLGAGVAIAPLARLRRSRGQVQLRKVFRAENGRLLVDSGRISFKYGGPPPTFLLATLRRVPFSPDGYIWHRPEGLDFFEALEMLRRIPGVHAVEPDFLEHIPTRAIPTTDPVWHLENAGRCQCVKGADVDAAGAWLHATGAGKVIAVIDDGFDLNHPELTGSWHPFSSCIDSAGPSRPAFLSAQPREHGTSVAGMAAGRSCGQQTGCGLAKDAQVLAIAIHRIASQCSIADGIALAADHADVITCSLGPDFGWMLTTILSDALTYAGTFGRGGLGVPVFWAVPNGGGRVSRDEVCCHDSVTAVGGTDCRDQHGGCATGPEIALVAPGIDVVTTGLAARRVKCSGTSFAAPLAAAAAALALEVSPSMRARTLVQLLKDSCDKIGNVTFVNGRNDAFGHGRLNARKLLESAQQSRLNLGNP